MATPRTQTERQTERDLINTIYREGPEFLKFMYDEGSEPRFIRVQQPVVLAGPPSITYRSTGRRATVSATVVNGGEKTREFEVWGKTYNIGEDGTIRDSRGKDCTLACYIEAARHFEVSTKLTDAALTQMLYYGPRLDLEEIARNGIKTELARNGFPPLISIFKYHGSPAGSESLETCLYRPIGAEACLVEEIAKNPGIKRTELERKYKELHGDTRPITTFDIAMQNLIEMMVITEFDRGSSQTFDREYTLAPGFAQKKFRSDSGDYIGIDSRTFIGNGGLREQLIYQAIASIVSLQDQLTNQFSFSHQLLGPEMKDKPELLEHRLERVRVIRSAMGLRPLDASEEESFKRVYGVILDKIYDRGRLVVIHGDSNWANALVEPTSTGSGFLTHWTGLKKMCIGHWYQDVSRLLMPIKTYSDYIPPVGQHEQFIEAALRRADRKGNLGETDFQEARDAIDLDTCLDLAGAAAGISQLEGSNLSPARRRTFRIRVAAFVEELRLIALKMTQEKSVSRYDGEFIYSTFEP